MTAPNPQDDDDVLWMKIAMAFGVYAASRGGSAQTVLGVQDNHYYLYKAAANLYSAS